jgi:hypothetical protein
MMPHYRKHQIPIGWQLTLILRSEKGDQSSNFFYKAIKFIYFFEKSSGQSLTSFLQIRLIAALEVR